MARRILARLALALAVALAALGCGYADDASDSGAAGDDPGAEEDEGFGY